MRISRRTMALLATVATAALAPLPGRATVLTGGIEFSTLANGDFPPGRDEWNTLGQDRFYNLYFAANTINGPFINTGNGPNTSITTLTNGTNTFWIFGEAGDDNNGNFGLNLFFNHDILPDISVKAPTRTTVGTIPAFSANSSLNTLALNGTTPEPGSGSLTFVDGLTTVTLTTYFYSTPNVFNQNRVQAFDTTPSGGLDFVGEIVLTVSTQMPPPPPVSEPASLALVGAGLLGIGLVRRRRQGS